MLDAFFDEDCYKLYTKKTNKFLTNKLEIVFINDYSLKTLVYLDLIKNIFLNGPDYLSLKEFLCTLENYYDLSIYISNERVGRSILTKISLTFLNSKYNKINSLNKIIELLFSILYKPKLNVKILNKEKTNLLNELLLNKDNLSVKNIKKALSFTSKDVFYNYSDYKKILDSITINKIKTFLYSFYEYSKKYIYFIGDYPGNKIYSLIKEYNQFNSIQTNTNIFYLDDFFNKRCKNISRNKGYDYLEVVQIYTHLNLSKFEKNYCLPLFNIIIGSSFTNSIIFKKLREEEGLVYGINTFYKKHDNLLILETSLDKKNYNKSIRLIRNSFKEVKKGIFDKTLLEDAKKFLINNLNSKSDTNSKIINACIYKTIFNDDDIETKIDNYNKVSVKDIINVSNKIKLIINYRNGEYNEES